MPSSRRLIASNTLTGSTASVTFSNIPQTYTDLILRASVRTDASAVWGDVATRPTSGTTNDFSWTYLLGNGATASSSKTASGSDAQFANNYTANGNTATSNSFGSLEMYIPNYTSSSAKPISVFGVTETNATTAYIILYAELFNRTNAITSLFMFPNQSSNFLTGSSFFLYGLVNS